MKTFIDLFAGLGGFHLGLSKSGYKCVFASEIDRDLSELYEKNFGIKPHGDIRNIDVAMIPHHDVLCAGFPCQPFSSAGKKEGAKCPRSGKLIDEVFKVIQHHLPSYVLLENVPQILTIQNGHFWKHIKDTFDNLDYNLSYKIYSPKQFGIPQNRDRVFVVASRKHIISLANKNEEQYSVDDILSNENESKLLEISKLEALSHWQEYLNNIPVENSNTIFAAEFGATYPLVDLSTFSLHELRKYSGAFGKPLEHCRSYEDIYSQLPEYIAKKQGKIPQWAQGSIVQSRTTYQQNKDFLDKWKLAISSNTSWQKLEWRAGRENFDIFENIIQFRASGIRVSRPTHIPSLVAMTPTQIPIIGKAKRYLSPREAARLQALDSLPYLLNNTTKSFKALGNAVNAKIIAFIARQLVWE